MRNQLASKLLLLSYRPFIKKIVLFLFIINSLICTYFVVSLYNSWKNFEAETKKSNQNIALILEQNISATLGKIDLVVFHLIQNIQEQLTLKNKTINRLQSEVALLKKQIPEMDGIRFANEFGEIVLGTDLEADLRASIADRDYFLEHKHNPKSELIISPPVIGRVTSKWMVILSRRVNYSDGSFAGVAYGVLNLQHFENLFASIHLGTKGVIVFRNSNNILITRYPRVVSVKNAEVGDTFVSKEVRGLQNANVDYGHFTITSPIDSTPRLYYYRKFTDFPFYLLIAQAESDFLKEWYLEMYRTLVLVLGFIFFTLIAGIRIVYDSKHRAAVLTSLAIEEEKYRSIYDNAMDGIYLSTLEGELLSANPAFLKLFNYDSFEEMIDKSANLTSHIRYHKLTYDEFIADLQRLGMIRDLEVAIVSADNTIRYGLVNAHLVKREGESNYYEGIIRDITEHKRFEEDLKKSKEFAEAATQAKTLYLTNMSHEIRTPMNSVIGLIDVLSETSLTVEQKSYVDSLQTAGNALIELINNVLDMNRIESGQLHIETKEFNIFELVNTVDSLLRPKANLKKVSFFVKIDEAIPHYLIGDPLRIRQIMINLISNAIKFTKEGHVELKIEMHSLLDNIATLKFIITDTGIGIKNEQIDKLFSRYSQLGGHITSEYGGSGLGLNISNQLLKLMGGEFFVASELGVGSIFTIILPLNLAPNHVVSIDSMPPSQLDILIKDKRPLKILLADDSEENQWILKLFMKELPYEIHTALNGDEALLLFYKNSYDLVLLDMQMPIRNGYATAKAIREWERESGKAMTPILAITGQAITTDGPTTLDAGCNAQLIKPIKKAQLLKAILELTT